MMKKTFVESKPVRLGVGAVALVVMVAVGYWSYLRFLAPEPEGPEPVAEATEPVVISAEGRLLPEGYVSLAFAAPGRVAAVYVDVGDPVDVGQVLVSLDADQAEAMVEQARAALVAAQAAQDLEPDYAPQERKDMLAANVQQAAAALDAALAALEDTRLRAPFAGTVASVDVEEGEVVTPGIPVVHVADFSGWKVETLDLREEDVVMMEVGQFVEVTFAAIPDVVFPGVVTEIALNPSSYQGNVTYTVTVELINPDSEKFRWGMTAFLTIRPDLKVLHLLPQPNCRGCPEAVASESAVPDRPPLP